VLKHPPQASAESKTPQDYRDRHEELTGASFRECPVCHRGHMFTVETLPAIQYP
jgi:hypothetical protein